MNAATSLKFGMQAAMEVLKDGYQGDVIGEATPDVLISEFVRFLSFDFLFYFFLKSLLRLSKRYSMPISELIDQQCI